MFFLDTNPPFYYFFIKYQQKKTGHQKVSELTLYLMIKNAFPNSLPTQLSQSCHRFQLTDVPLPPLPVAGCGRHESSTLLNQIAQCSRRVSHLGVTALQTTRVASEGNWGRPQFNAAKNGSDGYSVLGVSSNIQRAHMEQTD